MAVTLEQAIRDFPMIAWLSEHTQVKDSGGRNFYAQKCPVCQGEKTLAVWRETKVVHCFKCDPNEGGRGGDVWNGKAGLVRFISIVEHISFAEAIKLIYERSGYPDPPRIEREIPKQLMPEGIISLKGVSETDPTVQYLKKRKLQHLQDDISVALKGPYRGRLIVPVKYLQDTIGFEAKTYTKQSPPSLYADWFDTYSQVYTSKKFDLGYPICFITESIFDAESFEMNGIGCFGGFKLGQIERLLDLKKRGIKQFVWALDADAWNKQLKHILEKTMHLIQNFVFQIPDGHDPNSLPKEQLRELAASARPIRDEFDLVTASLDFGKY